PARKSTMPKTVFITGATSGFGLAAARRFVSAGWKVVATGRRADRLQSLVAELGADNVHPAVFDVRDAAAMDAALAALPEAFAGIDVLVNNAGLALGTAPATHAPPNGRAACRAAVVGSRGAVA